MAAPIPARTRRRLLTLLGGLALGSCGPGRSALERMCLRECEQTGRTFEEVEACRSRCREAYRGPPPSTLARAGRLWHAPRPDHPAC